MSMIAQISPLIARLRKMRLNPFALAAIAGMVLCISTRAGAAEQFDINKTDAEIARRLKRISSLAANPSGDPKALETANSELLSYMRKVCTNKALLTDSLKQAKNNGLMLAGSSDGKLRYFTWDTMTGGTMHFYDSLVAYQGGNQTFCKELNNVSSADEGNPGVCYTQVDSIADKSGKTVYLVRSQGIYSGRDHSLSIDSMSINGNELKPVPFFFTKTKRLSSIGYSVSSSDYDPSKELIQLTDQNRTLKIPVVTTDGQATGRFLKYRFDGNKFVFQEK